MAAAPLAQLFVVVHDGTKHSLERVPTSADLQAELGGVFLPMQAQFFDDIEFVGFAPSYEPSRSELFRITDFSAPDFLKRTTTSPDSYPEFRPPAEDSDVSVKAILCVVTGRKGGSPLFLFQHFDRRKMLKTRFTIVFRKGTFSRLADPGIVIGNHLDAVIHEGTLTFRSFHLASQFLPLQEYFKEATDDDIREFVDNKLFVGGDAAEVIQSANQVTRRRVSFVLKSGVLSGPDVTPTSLKAGAKKFDLDLKLKGAAGKQRVEFPKGASDVRVLLHFLAEGLYVGPISGEPYVANSYRRLN